MEKCEAKISALIVLSLLLCLPYPSFADEQGEGKPPEWFTRNIDCSESSALFEVRFFETLADADLKFQGDFIEILYSIYYIAQRANGVLIPSFAQEETLQAVTFYCYGLCKKQKEFSLFELVNIDQSLKKEFPSYYNDFQVKYAPVIRMHVGSIQQFEEDRLRERLKEAHQRARDLME